LVQHKIPLLKRRLAELPVGDTEAALVDRLADIDAGFAAAVAGWDA
jgi:hypothetical protein